MPLQLRDAQRERVYAILSARPGILCCSGAGDPPLRRGGAVDGAGGLRLAVVPGTVGRWTVSTSGSRAGRRRASGRRRWIIWRPMPTRVGDADSTVARAHACAAGAKNRRRASGWPSRGGFSTKLHGLATPSATARLLPDRRAAGRRPASPASVDLLHRHRGDPTRPTTPMHPSGRGSRWSRAAIPPKPTCVHQRVTDGARPAAPQDRELFGFMKQYAGSSPLRKAGRRDLAFVHLVAACILLR